MRRDYARVMRDIRLFKYCGMKALSLPNHLREKPYGIHKNINRYKQ